MMASNDSNLRWESGSPLLGGISGDQNSWASSVRERERERESSKRENSNETGERKER